MLILNKKTLKEEMFGKKSLKDKVDKIIDIIIEKNYYTVKEKKPISKEEKDNKKEIDTSRVFIALCEAVINCFEEIEQELGINLGPEMKPITKILDSLN